MILIKNAVIVNEHSEFHLKKRDLLLENGIIKKIGVSITATDAQIIKRDDLHVSIGWIDSSVTLGEPGYEERATIESGLNNAATGGFTTILLNPNNNPNPENKSGIDYIKSLEAGHAVTIIPVGSLTVNQQGTHLAELYDMKMAGAASFYDYKKPIHNSQTLKLALQYSSTFNAVVQSYPENSNLSHNGIVNEDSQTINLGLKTAPQIAEDVQIARDLTIASYTGGNLHIPTVSTASGLKLIKKSKLSNVTCSVAIAHLALDSTALSDFNSAYKLQPPLRDYRNRKKLLKALDNGSITMVTSDHNPSTIEEKQVEFNQARNGSIGLKDTFTVLNNLTDVNNVVKVLTGAYQVFNNTKPIIEENAPVNLTLFSPTISDSSRDENLRENYHNALHSVPKKGCVYGIINGDKIRMND